MDPKTWLMTIEAHESRSHAYKWIAIWKEWHATGIVPQNRVAVRAIARHESLVLQARALTLQLTTTEREGLERKARALQAIADRPDRWAGFELSLR